MPPKCKLIYFPVTGRAEMTRLMFAAAGVKYEDERIKWEDWPKLKTGRQRLYSGDGTECIIIFCEHKRFGHIE